MTNEEFGWWYFTAMHVTVVHFCIAGSALFLPRFSCLMKIVLLPLKDNLLGPNNMFFFQSGHFTHVNYLLHSLWNNNK